MKRVKKNKAYYKGLLISALNIVLQVAIEFVRVSIAYTIYLIAGTLYIIYLLIRWFDNMIIKEFYKIPRVARVVMIYAFIGITIYSICNPRQVVVYKDKIVKIDQELGQTLIETQAKEEEEPQYLEYIEPVNKCEMSEVECKIYDKAIENGLTNDQAYILLAISKHETGRWTSNAFINKNNLGGIMGRDGLRVYDTLDEGIEAFANLLKRRYFEQGLDTIEKIQPVYCPLFADNDPYNQNQYWLSGVTQFYNEYTK